MRWWPSTIVPSGLAFREPACPGRNDSISSGVEAFAYCLSFAGLRELSGCNGFRGGGVGCTAAHFPPTRARSWAFSSKAAMIASSSDSPDALKRFCVSITRR
jgi:hypothetical protein